MTRELKISLVQMPVVANEPETNVETAARAIGEAARRGSDLVVLPEMWTTGFALRDAVESDVPDRVDGEAVMRDLARANHVHLVGSVLLRAGERCANTLLAVTADGEVGARYEKMHRFAPMDEHLYIAAGNEPVMYPAPWGPTGLAICYDLRFPELFRHLVAKGAETILLSAEWPHPRLEHWRTLLRARAIENQCVVVACNASGRQGNSHFCGHSAVLDPWGTALVEAGEEETVLTVTVDMDAVARVRHEFPVLGDRRPEL